LKVIVVEYQLIDRFGDAVLRGDSYGGCENTSTFEQQLVDINDEKSPDKRGSLWRQPNLLETLGFKSFSVQDITQRFSPSEGTIK